jgi:predicted urease superfamily metal-dependent hydrolase
LQRDLSNAHSIDVARLHYRCKLRVGGDAEVVGRFGRPYIQTAVEIHCSVWHHLNDMNVSAAHLGNAARDVDCPLWISRSIDRYEDRVPVKHDSPGSFR